MYYYHGIDGGLSLFYRLYDIYTNGSIWNTLKLKAYSLLKWINSRKNHELSKQINSQATISLCASCEISFFLFLLRMVSHSMSDQLLFFGMKINNSVSTGGCRVVVHLFIFIFLNQFCFYCCLLVSYSLSLTLFPVGFLNLWKGNISSTISDSSLKASSFSNSYDLL